MKLASLLLLLSAVNCLASDGGVHAIHLDGAHTSLLWSIPFVGILLSIAFLPLLAPAFWHHHYGKVSLFWGAGFLIAFWIAYGTDMVAFTLAEVFIGEFLPFIILLLALFTISGGIAFRGTLRGSPWLNTGILVLGTVLASMMGTTGASMLLIRPLLRANSWRKHRVHSVVFFIFLVANIGGSLTPLGDPPLFLGFLKGISFFWTTTQLLWPTIFLTVVLITGHHLLDVKLFRDENPLPDDGVRESFRVEGSINFLLLLGVIGAVILSGVWHSDLSLKENVAISFFGTALLSEGTLTEELLLVLLIGLSLWLTPKSARAANEFSWGPILEVAKLFSTIFLTMVPTIAILRSGTEGALASVVRLVTDQNSQPVNTMYFWCTGLLSSFLDNAPTYLVFFNTAGGNAEQLMGPLSDTLRAISAGAVFMGANTYIGNAPNFMVKSIAEESRVKMPSFFGYMAWSMVILIPLFLIETLIFF